jgi:hypothetical protein
MKKLDNIIDQFLMKLYKKQGNHLSELMLNWSKIAGPAFANNTKPSKIKTQIYNGQKINILYIQVTDSSKAIEISYSESLILERIAIYLGKKIIQRMRVQIISIEESDHDL